jgi:hypothetical protein
LEGALERVPSLVLEDAENVLASEQKEQLLALPGEGIDQNLILPFGALSFFSERLPESCQDVCFMVGSQIDPPEPGYRTAVGLHVG